MLSRMRCCQEYIQRATRTSCCLPKSVSKYPLAVNPHRYDLTTKNLSLTSVNKIAMHGGVTGEDKSLKLEKVGTKKILTFMMSYVWPKNNSEVKKRVAFSLSLLVGAKILNVQVPFLFKRIVDTYSEAGLSVDTPEGVALTTGMLLILGYGSARASAALFGELRDAVFAKVAQRSIRNIARNLFAHLHDLDLKFHLSRQTGALSKAIDRGTRGINFVLRALVFNIVPTTFEVTLVSMLLWYKCGGDYAMITLATLAAYATWTLSITAWRTKYRVRMNAADGKIGTIAVDSLINYETVKYFNNEAYEVKRYDKVLADYEDANLKTNMSLALLNFGQQAIFTCGLTSIMLLAAHGIQSGNLTVGDLVLVNGLLFQLSMPLNFLGSVYRDIRQAVIDMQSMLSLMNTKQDVSTKVEAPKLVLAKDQSSIKFDNLTFGYTPEKDILKNLNFEVEPGQKIGIVGGSGSGKSTIVRMLYRFYDPQEGTVLLGGKDIRNLDVNSVRQIIGIVPQETVLFHDTIYHNIAYGDLSASQEDVFNAARMADIHEAILKMPQGYETQVGERGLKLSGGEKQRVAIARAILKNPTILVYDEATSSLDSITEENILAAVQRISQNKTSVFIAHRLSTVMDCDKILVLGNGRVVEEGSHAQLLANHESLYYQLWSSQHKGVFENCDQYGQDS